MDVVQVVDNGFNMLSREQRDRVNLEVFDIHSWFDCVIGQLFPDEFFYDACQELSELENGTDEFYDWIYDYGFDVNPDSTFNYYDLQAEWIRRFKAERGLLD